MSIHSEQEFKTLITPAQSAAILAALPFAPAFDQTNTYYDTPDFALRQQNQGLRIRQFATRAEQTLKQPHGAGHQLLEITDPLTVSEARALISANSVANHGQIKTTLEAAGIEPSSLQQFAAAVTRRRVSHQPGGLVTVDETHYPNGHSDFELELEYTTDAHDYWQTLLKQFAITPSPVQNKVARAAANVSNSQAH